LLRSVIDLADRWLNLSRLELSVYVDNAPAIAFYEKCGFKREGRFEHHAFRDGEYVNKWAYGAPQCETGALIVGETVPDSC